MSLTKIEFQQRFEKITNQFGAAPYRSQDRINFIFDEVKSIRVGDFERVVNHLVANSRQAPLVADFKKAIQDLGVKRVLGPASYVPEAVHVSTEENYEYCIRDNFWADNHKVYCRGNSIRECFTVYKKDYPDHPLVVEDQSVRAERLKEVKSYLSKGQYAEYLKLKTGSVSRGTLSLVIPMEGA